MYILGTKEETRFLFILSKNQVQRLANPYWTICHYPASEVYLQNLQILQRQIRLI